MERMQRTCGNCGGAGAIARWKTTTTDTDAKIKMAEYEEVVCENCNGRGYTEYVVFSVEEAEAILKHCGLKT